MGQNSDTFNYQYLILTRRGGSGHSSFVESMVQRITKQSTTPHPNIFIENMTDWTPIIKQVSKLWDFSLKHSLSPLMKFLVAIRKINDILSAPFTFFRLLEILKKNKISEIIDCQPTSLLVLLYTIDYFNRQKRSPTQPKVILRRILCELPVNDHYMTFSDCRAIPTQRRHWFKLESSYQPLPVLRKQQSAEQFWQTSCSLPLNQIVNNLPPPLRNDILDVGSLPQKPRQFRFDCTSQDEKNLLTNQLNTAIQTNHTHWVADEKNFVLMIMLGGVGSYALTDYLKAIARTSKNNFNTRITLLLCCGEHHEGTYSLYQHVIDHSRYVSIPNELNVIPLGKQSSQSIATMYKYANAFIIKSGGCSSMEILEIAKNDNERKQHYFIHSPIKNHAAQTLLSLEKEARQKKLLHAIPFWEAHNAHYLMTTVHAQLTHPAIFNIYEIIP